MLLLPPGGGGGSAPTIPWPWVPGSPIVTWPDIPDFSYLADIEISTSYTIPSSSSEDATVYPSVGGYFDVHAHSFCSTESDWATAEVSYDCLPTNTVDRIDWLYDALTAEGIGMAAISGQADPSAGSDFIADTATVNEVTLFAYQRYPDFFAPFIQIFPEDLTDSTFGASSYVDALLAAGEFKGVGELFIHGHGTNINENGYLYGICLAAARYGAPVQMHYEIGFVDDESVRTSEDNYDQLVALLDMFINVPIASHTYHVDTEPMPLKVILCHCGGAPRPGNYAAWDSTDEDLYVAYIARMEALLARYPNVFFDLAGMQVGGNQQLFPGSSYGGTETRFGSDLLTLIAAYPSRFLFGTDTENRYDVDTYAYSYTAVSPGWAWYNGVDHWQDSVQGYVDFLGTLGATIQAQVMGANTVFAIYTKARRI